jgi:transcriptional regulator with XRE-family HTH domain
VPADVGGLKGVTQNRDQATPNAALYNLRDALAESQQDVADALNQLAARRGKTAAVTANQVSRWERGIVHPSPLYRQLLAEHFGVSVAELGLVRQRNAPLASPAHVLGPATGLHLFEEGDAMQNPEVAASQEQWLHTRRLINAHHTELAKAAAQLYPDDVRVGTTGLVARPEWISGSPLVDLANVEIALDSHAPEPLMDGTEDVSSHTRPLWSAERRYQRYSHAVRDVARPKLFENRPSWRLLDVKFAGGGARLAFGHMNYFDAMDISEAVAHETAAALVVNNDTVSRPTWRGLHLRKAIGDPFDLTRRAALLSINTLTIRRDRSGSASVVLHNRSAANVATSGGIIGVMPAGVFQPSSVRAREHGDDFDLWRNVMREYSEEFLGNPEHAGDGPGADYTQEPLRSLDVARAEGRIRVYLLGLALGALDMWAGLETVAVIDADTFDDIFADLVRINDEGTVVRAGQHQPTAHIPFTREVINELIATGRLAPETAFSLETAWAHRDQLLSPPTTS